MSFAPVDNSLEGRVLAADLFTENGILLLPEATVITAAHVQLLQKQRISEVEVLQELAEGVKTNIRTQLMELDADEKTVAAYIEA